MEQSSALIIAINILERPTQARTARNRPLPDGLVDLLEIAAGDEDAILSAVASSARSRDTVREAAVFFIEQILFHHAADSYRVLGARPNASSEELRRNMALLLRWLHPDVQERNDQSLFAGRVTKAWNDLKTADRRALYDRSRAPEKVAPRRTTKSPTSSTTNRSPRAQVARVPPRPNLRKAPPKRSQRPLPHSARPMNFWRRFLLLVFGRVVS